MASKETSPPLITDPNCPAQLEELYRFMSHCEENAQALPAKEAVYLRDFFNAYSARMTDVLASNRYEFRDIRPLLRQYIAPQQKLDVAQLVVPQKLSDLFCAVASHYKTAIRSEIMILPTSFVKEEPRHSSQEIAPSKPQHFKNSTELNFTVRYNGFEQRFGFVQLFDLEQDKKWQGAVAIPYFAIDDEILSALSAFDTKDIMRHLQSAMSLSNHDMLHSYTPTYINNRVAAESKSSVSKAIDKWAKQFDRLGRFLSVEGYEMWATLSHIKTWPYLAQTPSGQVLPQTVSDYFDKLQILKEQMITDGKTVSETHNICDFLGSIMAFTLMRLVPQNDPLMLDCVRRMEAIDPLPAMMAVNEICRASKSKTKILQSRFAKDRLHELIDVAMNLSEATGDKPIWALRQISLTPALDFKTLADASTSQMRETLTSLYDDENKKTFIARDQMADALLNDIRRIVNDHQDALGTLLKDNSTLSAKIQKLAFDHIYKDSSAMGQKTKRIMNTYCEAGYDIFPAPQATPTYEQIKQYQLIRGLKNVAPLHLEDYSLGMRNAHRKTDMIDLEMVQAAAYSVDYRP